MDRARLRFYVALYRHLIGWRMRREIILDGEPTMAYFEASHDSSTDTFSVHLDLQGPFWHFTNEDSLRIVADVTFARRSPNGGFTKFKVEGKPAWVAIKEVPNHFSFDGLSLRVDLNLPLVPIASPDEIMFLRAPGEKDKEKS